MSNLPGFATFTIMYPTNMVYSTPWGSGHGGPHVPLLSGLNHNNRLKPQAVATTMYDSLQPCSSLARLTTTMAGDMDEGLA